MMENAFCRVDSLLEFFQFLQQHFKLWSLVDIVYINVADNAFLVDDEKSSFTGSIRTQHTIFFCHCTMRVEIGEDRKP